VRTRARGILSSGLTSSPFACLARTILSVRNPMIMSALNMPMPKGMNVRPTVPVPKPYDSEKT
jgi:hypothetical protein